jgi:glycosyltransferase involved in cell wall biosynthesis
MRILYAIAGYKPAWELGGPVTAVSATAEALVRKGHQVTVVTTNANFGADLDVPLDRPVDVGGVTVWYFHREEPLRRLLPFVPYVAGSLGYLYAPRMRSVLEDLVPRADVVDTQTPFVYPTYAASRAALAHGKPLFYHQRGMFLPPHLGHRRVKKQIYLELFEKPALRRASALIALTDAEREAFRGLGLSAPCEVIPNGVHVPAPAGDAAARALARWGIPPESPVILFLGRMQPGKGADELIDAFTRVRREHPGATLVMAGTDRDNLAARRARTEGILFTGFVTGADKSDLLERAAVFCLPSDGEGLSNAMLEALAHGTAVMLSPGCNFPDAEAAGAGVTVPKDAAAMAEALTRLLADRDRLRLMGRAGRRLVEARYSWDVVIERLLDVYERAASTSRSWRSSRSSAPALAPASDRGASAARSSSSPRRA